MTAFISLLLAFLLSLAATPLASWLGERWRLMAIPGGRRQHPQPVSRIGGLGLFVGFFGTALGLYFFAPGDARLRLPLNGVLLGTAFVFLFGLADDKYEFKAGPQFAAQVIAAAIAIATTVFIEQVTLPFKGFTTFRWYITYPLTVMWVVGMMNTVNFLDGLDGLATGVGGIAAVLFAIHSLTLGQLEIAWYSLALAGACAGFLLFNFHPAKVFLGSGGAMTLGFALATLSILAPARVMTALLVMVIPIADTAFQVFNRWREGRSPFQGDRGHLHYRLLDLGYSQKQIVLGYWFFCAVSGALVLLIESRVYKLIALGALGVIVVGVLLALSRKQG
jgi:UDP-GlcNAc:undecaprenyl-phosphate GlcNAc-1-phosphate transferase